MATAITGGVYSMYSDRPGSLFYGEEAAGPPIRYEKGRVVELGDTEDVDGQVVYGSFGGIYVSMDAAELGSVRYADV